MGDQWTGWRTTFHILLLHSTQPRLFLAEGDAGWSLPCVVSDRHVWWRSIRGANGEVRKRLGRHLSCINCISSVEDLAGKVAEHIYVFESPARPTMPGVWFDWESARSLTFEVAEHRDLVEQCLAEAAGMADPDLRLEWDRRGWTGQATTWFRQTLEALGYRHVESVQCIYKAGLAAVLHAETSAGGVYMKAASYLPTMADEPRVTALLAAQFPRLVPEPIHIDHKRRWMLLPDLGYPIRDASDEEKAQVLLAFGDLQRQAVGLVGELIDIGCPDRRLLTMAADVDLITGIDRSIVDLSDDEIRRLRSMGPRLRDIIRALASYNLPATLGHGDMHPGNVAQRNGEYVFFDWGLARVAHPFLDAWGCVDDSEIPMPEDAYLSLWTEYDPMDRLRSALRLARPLKCLAQVTDRYHWNTHIRYPEEFREDLTGRLRSLLDSLS